MAACAAGLFGPNNIADFAELELGKANFKVLERSSLGHLLQEFQLAYNLGDPQAARKYLQKGKLKTTKWVIKFASSRPNRWRRRRKASAAARSAR